MGKWSINIDLPNQNKLGPPEVLIMQYGENEIQITWARPAIWVYISAINVREYPPNSWAFFKLPVCRKVIKSFSEEALVYII